MAMLLYGLDNSEIGTVQGWRDACAELMPGLELRIFPEVGDARDITYLAFMHPDFDRIPALPHLRAMFSRSAGIESFIDHPRMPKVPLGKIEPAGGDPMMTEYVVMHVLRCHREMHVYAEAQARKEWLRLQIRRPEQRRIGFLGLGLMAKAPAQLLQGLGFPVSAWVRNPRAEDGITVFHGPGQLAPFLAQTDILVCLLPLTPQTRGVIDARALSLLPRGAHLLNAARGGHVVQADLLAALDQGRLAGAALDVFEPEPLPADHPFWTHPKVVMTPHAASITIPASAAPQVVDNLRRARAGQPLLNLVDFGAGY